MDTYNLIGRNYNDSNLSRIQEYLESGGDPNFQLYGGVTVFNEAVSFPSDNIRVINKLIHAGADVNLSTHLGYTPLFLAVAHRKRSVVQALIKSGASVNAKDFLGQTVLHHAVREWVLELPETSIEYNPDMWIINELLNREDIDCNQVDFYGQTPLMRAVMYQQIEITSLLLRNKANPNIGNELSITPLHVAFSHLENYMGMELLLCGASIYSVDKRGRTPIDVLLVNGLDIQNNEMIHKPVVERLVKDVYPEYFLEIFDMLPEFSLFNILQMTACSRKRRKAEKQVKELVDLFSIMDIIYIFSEYLSYFEVFCLIVAFSDVVVTDSMHNLHKREYFYNFVLN